MVEIPSETQEKLQSWAESTTNEYDELAGKFEKIYQALMDQGMDIEKANKAARFKVYQDIRGAVQSNAIPVEGILLGTADARDTTEAAKNRTLNRFNSASEAERQRMINNGEVKLDESGNAVPLDTREEIGGRRNPSYGKEYTPFMVRPVVGMARIAEDGGPLKLMSFVLRQDNVEKNVPVGEPVKFMANVRNEADEKLVLTDSTLTQFDTDDVAEDLEGISWSDAFDNIPNEFETTLENLGAWHDDHADDMNRIVATTGWITGISDNKTSVGNYAVFVSSDEFSPDEDAVSLWLDESQYESLNRDYEGIGEGTELNILGRSNKTADGRLSIEVYGLKPRTIMSLDALDL